MILSLILGCCQFFLIQLAHFNFFFYFHWSYLQLVKQRTALAGLPTTPYIERLSAALGVAQHHDAVSGTAKQHVTDDYVMRLYDAIFTQTEGR